MAAFFVFGALFMIAGYQVLSRLSSLPLSAPTTITDSMGNLRIMGWIFITVGFLAICAGIGWELHGRSLRRLRETGASGTVEVLRIDFSNTYVLGAAWITAQLQVEVPGKAPYQLEKWFLIPKQTLYQLKPGNRLSIYVDRANAKRFFITWPGA